MTLEPRGARTFELASLSGVRERGHPAAPDEPGGPEPGRRPSGPRGARWYEDSKLNGIREVVVDGDKKIVPDRDAPPLWARFYEIDTNRPFFCGRDGVKKYDMAEIEAERRNGYAWYGDWGNRVLERYARWEKERSKNGPGRRKNEREEGPRITRISANQSRERSESRGDHQGDGPTPINLSNPGQRLSGSPDFLFVEIRVIRG